ncbi:MAG: hypothetical protein ACRDBR_01810, partial [Metamycoplasmataceae bacterium]
MYNNNKYNLLKLGVSEAKRKDIKSIYVKYAFWLRENNGKILTTEKIFNDWKDLDIYVGEYKKEMKITREISLINKLGLGRLKKENSGFLVEASDVSKNAEIEDDIKLWGIDKIDFFFFQLILKQTYISKNKKHNSFKDIYEFLEANNFELNGNILINKDYEEYIQKIIIDKNDEEIYKLIQYKSGTPKKSDNYDENKIKDKIINLFIKLQIEKNIDFSIEIKNLLLTSKWTKFPKGLSFLLFGKTISLYELIENNENYSIKVLENDEFFNRIKFRMMEASKNDYLYLIRSHFNCLSILFEFDNENVLKIGYLQKEEINKIINSDKLNELILDKYYSPTEFIE